MNKKRNNKGFSLVELIVVIAVMAVLVVVLAPAYLRYVEKARLQKDVSAIAEVVETVKLSVAEEAVSKEIVSGTTKILINKDGVIKVKGVKVGDATAASTTYGTEGKLYTEVTATVGTPLKLSSKALTKDSTTNFTGVEITVSIAANGSATFTINGPVDAKDNLGTIATTTANAAAVQE